MNRDVNQWSEDTNKIAQRTNAKDSTKPTDKSDATKPTDKTENTKLSGEAMPNGNQVEETITTQSSLEQSGTEKSGFIISE
jgi:hypothetical protein